jgi:uncharacterized protein
MLIVVTVVFLLGGLVKGVAGVGLPTVAIALMALLVGLREGVALAVLPTLLTNVWQALAGGQLVPLLRRLWSFLLSAGLGAWFGAAVLARGDVTLLSAMLGVLLCVYSAVSLITPQIPSPGRLEGWLSPVMGGASGLVAGMSGSYAIPGLLYLQSLGLKRDHLVQAMGIAFLTFTGALGASLAREGLISAETGALSLAAAAPALVGMAVGQALRRRLSEALFRRIFFIALLGIGAWLALRPWLL